MSVDAGLLWAFLAVFARCSAMVLASPFFGGMVPVTLRVFICAVLSMSLVPVVGAEIATMPASLLGLAVALAAEVVIGLIIGGMMQLLASAFQMAGAMLDMQMGLGAAQMFSPVSGHTSTPVGQFKFFLALVLLFLINAHHLMIGAFVSSYGAALPPGWGLGEMLAAVLAYMGSLMLVALQIAAPVGAVCIVIDAAAAFINKAVPQTVPFLLAYPAKLMLGMLVLALGLPAMVVAAQGGVALALRAISQSLGM